MRCAHDKTFLQEIVAVTFASTTRANFGRMQLFSAEVIRRWSFLAICRQGPGNTDAKRAALAELALFLVALICRDLYCIDDSSSAPPINYSLKSAPATCDFFGQSPTNISTFLSDQKFQKETIDALMDSSNSPSFRFNWHRSWGI
jgi:hypothetical protein